MSSPFFSLFSDVPSNLLIDGEYKPILVVISVSIAIFASFMALQVASQTLQSDSKKRNQISLFIGSVALGGGIWSMHFIGMLAFELCTAVEYGWGLTLLSLFPGVGASWIALHYIMQSQRSWKALLVGGGLVGAGIGTMHYTGMAAMEMAPLLRYDLSIFMLSIVVAISLAILSLWIRFGLSKIVRINLKSWHVNLISSVVMGLAISGMHYTGMAAARFVRPPGLELSQQSEFTSYYLAFGVSLATVAIISMVLGLSVIFKYKDSMARTRHSERRVRAMMDTAVDAIIIINSKGAIIEANKATNTLLGWSVDELKGQNVNILMPEPFHSKHDDYLSRYLQTNEAKIIGVGREVRAQHRDGNIFDVRLAIGHLNIGLQDYFVAFISDISDRTKMEKAIRQSESKFRSLIGNIPGIAYRCSIVPPWPMLFISDAVEDITGFPASEFLPPNPQRSFLDLIHPEDRHKATRFSNDQTKFDLEYRIIHKDGQIRWMMEYGRQFVDEHTGEQWLDGFIMDMTARRQMEEQLREAKNKAEQAAAARAAFMANMSHEIRTPMNAIIGFSDILLESALDDEQLRHLNTINHSAKSLLHLLNDILDSAKLDKGKMMLEMREFSLIQEVDAVVSTLWLQARKKGIDLRTDIDSTLENTYLGAPERIRQILTNLIGNGIKFTQRGYVEVKVQPLKSDMIEFVISDTGIGMTKEQLVKVFDAFTQADASMSRKFGGTGLGTTISKQLVELMGGTIHVSSEPEQGTTFRFTVPLKNAEGVTQQSTIEKVTLAPLTILIVDDIQQNIDLLTLLLRRNGHKILTARDGQQALIRMAAKESIDVVLMDIQMPIMDGLTAATKRRQYEAEKGLAAMPIIALTASVLEEDRAAAHQAGMQGFANKPVDINALNIEIATILQIPLQASPLAKHTNSANPLIDTDKGIAIWGSQDKYYQQVAALLDSLAKEVSDGIRFCQQRDWQSLKAFSHKYKGVCGNLNVNRLANHFAQMEVAAEQQSGHCRELFSNIKGDIEQLSAMVEQPVKVDSDSLHNQTNLSALLTLLQKVSGAVRHNEADEVLLSELRAFNQGQFATEIDLIYDALNDFEFALAQSHLDELQQTIKKQLGG